MKKLMKRILKINKSPAAENKQSNAFAKIERKNQIITISCTIAALVIISFFTPLYSIKNIEVEGNALVPTETLVKASGIPKGTNIFKASTAKAKKQLLSVAYVDTAEVKKRFPSTVKIVITENMECAYIQFLGNFVGIDAKGKILEIKQSEAELDKPVIKGIALTGFEIGSYVKLDDEETTTVLFDTIKYVQQNELAQSIKTIDLTDLNFITFLLANNATAELGKSDNLKYKISYLKAVVAELGEQKGGIVDLTDTENVTYRGGS